MYVLKKEFNCEVSENWCGSNVLGFKHLVKKSGLWCPQNIDQWDYEEEEKYLNELLVDENGNLVLFTSSFLTSLGCDLDVMAKDCYINIEGVRYFSVFCEKFKKEELRDLTNKTHEVQRWK